MKRQLFMITLIKSNALLIAFLTLLISCGSSDDDGSMSDWQFGTSVMEPSSDSPESVAGGSGARALGDFFGDGEHAKGSNAKAIAEDIEPVFSIIAGQNSATKSTGEWTCSKRFEENKEGKIECHKVVDNPAGGAVIGDVSGNYERGEDGNYHFQMEYAYQLKKAVAYDNCGFPIEFDGNIHCGTVEDTYHVNPYMRGLYIDGTCDTSANEGGTLDIKRLRVLHEMAISFVLKCDKMDEDSATTCEVSGYINVDGKNYQYERLREFQQNACAVPSN